jgi:hypothetical protein
MGDRWQAMNHRLITRNRNIVLATGLLASFCAAHVARAQNVSEYQVKAAYFYNFTKFVEWPTAAFASPSDPIRLCILNDKSFQTRLSQIAGNRQIAGHPVDVVLLHDGKQARGCHELFIGSSQSQDAMQVIDSLHGESVLTVGETNKFVEQGGIINFVVQGQHVQFQVNQKAATLAGLHMNAQLLSVAKRVFK